MLESSSFENKINIMRLKTQTFYSRESFLINFKEFMNECRLDILFRQITTFIKVYVAFVFSQIYQLKDLEPKTKAPQTFINYLTKKYI